MGVLCHLEDVEAEERSRAFSMLLSSPPTGDEDDETRFAELVGDTRARRFAQSLVELVIEDWASLDEVISATSKRWRLERMDRVDRNLLRMAAAELRHRDKTPRGAILAEAVRLASGYGNERSASFVNGLAVALADTLRPSEHP